MRKRCGRDVPKKAAIDEASLHSELLAFEKPWMLGFDLVFCMTEAQKPPRSSAIFLLSNKKFLMYSLLASFLVLIVSLAIQWLVYDDWLHHTGPLRVVGSVISSLITFAVVWLWQRGVERREHEMLRRFELILAMNDRIRNSLQAIECLTYLSDPEATQAVRDAVGSIDNVLREVLTDAADASKITERKAKSAAVAGSRKSA